MSNKITESFAYFLFLHKISCCSSKKESSQLIAKCENEFDDELDLNDLLKNIRQLKALMHDE